MNNQTDWYEKNKEHLQKYRQEYYLKNKEKLLAKSKLQGQTQKHKLKIQKKKEKTPELNLLRSSKIHAKRLNIEHTISIEDIIIPEYCPYLGIKLTNIQGGGVVWSNISIDRIDSSLGYTPKNIQIISRKANHIKSNLSLQDLILFSKNVLKLHE